MSAASASTVPVAPGAASGSSVIAQTGAELLPATDTLWQDVYHVIAPLPAPAGVQLWRACRTDTAEEIELRVVPGTKNDARSAAWTRVSAVGLPHLQRAREAHFVGGHRVEVSDAVGGTPLDAWRAARPAVDLATVEAVVRQLAEALGGLHASGLVHLGLRPAVVLVQEEKDGLHCTLGGLETVALFEGEKLLVAPTDPFYAPPEAATLHLHEPGPALCAWDWWSLGRVVQELILGHHVIESLPDADASQSAPMRAARAEALLLEYSKKERRAGAVELMVGLEPRLDLLLRGLLASAPEARWGGEFVDRWLRRQPVKEYYSVPRTEEKFRWRGRLSTVAEAAEELRTAERWAEAAAQVFEAGTPGTLANFLGKSPAHEESVRHLKELGQLAGVEPLRALPPTVAREVVLTLALLHLAGKNLVWRGQRINGDNLHALFAEEADPRERCAFARALTDRRIVEQIERYDFDASRSLSAAGRLAAEAEAIVREHGLLEGPNEAASAQVFRLALAPETALRAARERLRRSFAGSDHPAMEKIFKSARTTRAELIALAWAESAAAQCGFVTHRDWEARQWQRLQERGRRIVTALLWLRLRRAVAAGPAVFGAWPVFAGCWGVSAILLAVLWPGPKWLALALAPALLAAVVRVVASSAPAVAIRRVAPDARPWKWSDGAARCLAEMPATGQGSDPVALEAALAALNADIAKLTLLVPAPAPFVAPPHFDGTRAVALSSWLVLAALGAGGIWRGCAHPPSWSEFRVAWISSASVPSSAPVGAADGAVSTAVAAPRVAAEADVSRADIKVAWPYKPGDDAEEVVVKESAPATAAQTSYALKRGRELTARYRPETITTLLVFEVPAGDKIGLVIYDGVNRTLASPNVHLIEYRPTARAWVKVGKRFGIYLGQ